MSLVKTFLSLVLIALSVVDARPLVHRGSGLSSLRFAARLNLDTRTVTVPEMDRARFQSKKSASLGKRDSNIDVPLSSIFAQSVNITNTLVSYTAQVGIGNPQHNYSLLIDTGSSNTYVGLSKNNPYVPTKTSYDTKNTFDITYGSGHVSGKEWLDTLTLSPNLVIVNQSLGGVTSGSGAFNGVDGIIGVGPVGLTTKTVSNTYEVPTVMDNLYSQKSILVEALGVYFVPSTEKDNGGELTFGGYDINAVTSPVNYVPLTTTKDSSSYWGVNQTVSYGGQTILSNAAGIVDTGTVLTLFATDIYQKYKKLTGAVEDKATGLLTIDATQYANLQKLSFDIGGISYDLTPDAQIWPRSLNSAIGGKSDGIYLIINDLGTPSGSGDDFTNGYTWLQRFYTVYDTTNKALGFATTAYTNSEANYALH